uniref:SpoVT-AbrB domain-containing protein n=1 Tax=Candidatus Methanogaster sp. ANME-2c ERB4 TaxID=2759911 RepID=A0A7G9YDW8_9EURY|nr:hypothetical protein ABPEKODN_00015 [Methanosarcinales archaeon ANME-2c ERB4]
MFDFEKRNIMTMNYTRYLALPKMWIDAMRLGKGDQVKIEMDNENRLVITPAKEHGALPAMFVKVQYVSNGRTHIFCIFIDAGDSVILREIAGAEGNPKTGRRWYDRVKGSVEYVIQNWWLLMFVLDIFFGMWMQV